MGEEEARMKSKIEIIDSKHPYFGYKGEIVKPEKYDLGWLIRLDNGHVCYAKPEQVKGL